MLYHLKLFIGIKLSYLSIIIDITILIMLVTHSILIKPALRFDYILTNFELNFSETKSPFGSEFLIDEHGCLSVVSNTAIFYLDPISGLRAEMNAACLNAITGLTRLTTLELCFLDVHDGGRSLGAMTHLQEFDVSDVDTISIETILQLVTNAQELKWLSVYELADNKSSIIRINEIIGRTPNRQSFLTLTVSEELECWVSTKNISPFLRFEFIT